MKKRVLLLSAICLLSQCAVVYGEGEAEQEKQPWLVPYEETVEMHIANAESTTAEWAQEGDDVTNNVFTRAYKDWLNVDVITDWVSADYDESLNLAIASGDLPDVFLANNVQYTQLVEAGMLEDMTDVFEENLSDFAREQYDAVPAVVDAYRVDGRLYGIPTLYYGDIDKPYYMWLRKDWMEELGVSAPTTIDEMMSIIEQMNEKYGTRGIAEDKTLDNLLGIACAWHAYPGIWVEDEDGHLVYGSIQEEMKQVISTYADWYARGLINPNFAVQDSEAVKTDVINGKYGAQPFLQWWGWHAGTNVVEATGNNNSYFLPYAVPSVDENPVLYPLVFPNEKVLVVRKGYEHVDAAVKLMNLHLYVDSEAVKDGLIDVNDFHYYTTTINFLPFNVKPTMGDYNGYYQAIEYKKTGDPSVFTYSGNLDKCTTAEAFLNSGDTSGTIGGMLQMYHAQCAYSIGAGIVERDEFKRDAMWGAAPEVVNSYGSTLDDLLLEGFTLIITGQQPVEYFDTLVEAWKAAGGDEMTAAVNEMYRK